MKTAIRWAYVVVVLDAILPFGLGHAGWVAMATGQSGVGLPYLTPIVLFVIGVYRIVLVSRNPALLETPVLDGDHHPLRKIAAWSLLLGAVVSAINLLSRPLIFLVEPNALGDGPALLVASVYLSITTGLGVFGLLLFEFTRLRGFEQQRER